MPYDPTSGEKLIQWRIQAADYRRQAKSAATDEQRDVFLNIAESYESLIKSEELMLKARRHGLIE